MDRLVVSQVRLAMGMADVIAEADKLQVGAAVVPPQPVPVVDLHRWRDLSISGYPHDAVRADSLGPYADFAIEVGTQRFSPAPVAPP